MAPPVRVLSTRNLPKALQDRIRAVSPRIELDVRPAQRAEDIQGAFETAEVLYTGGVLPAPDAAPKLKWIQFYFAGLDQVAGQPALQRDIAITTTSGIHVPQMTEYVLMMMLAFAHHLPQILDLQRRVEWPKGRRELLLPTELRGLTVGLVGYGSIAREMARLCHALGMTVLATKRNAMDLTDSGYTLPGTGDPDGSMLRRLYPPQALKSMLAQCDFVVLTLPLTPATRGLFSGPELRAMKPTAILINVSRGGVVDEPALVEALREARIGGAALDVFLEEPLPDSSPLWKMPNVIVSPHISGASAHYDERAVDLFADNLRRYLSGQPLLNLVNRERGY